MRFLKFFIICASFTVVLSGCGGGGGGTNPVSDTATNSSTGPTTPTSTPIAPPPPSLTANQVPVLASGQAFNTVNRLYVDVTVCASGTSTCQTVHDVIVDSASFGLRLYASALTPAMLKALPVTKVALGTLNECSMFAGGNLWGSVRTADVQMAGEAAKAIPVQVIEDGANPVPSACSSAGTLNKTPASLGGNGLIGVGTLTKDCGTYCEQIVSNPYYYSCTGGTCTQTSVSVSQQVVNPVSAFSTDYNGVFISLPAVPPHGASSAPGTMTFGIDTQANNTLSSMGLATYTMKPNSQEVNATYNGTAMSAFFDTGSGMNYFSDNSIPECSNYSMFCPSSDLSLSTQVQGLNGASTSIPFTVGNGTALLSQNPLQFAIPALAATSGSNSMLAGAFDFGLPFFFGRTVGFLFSDSASTATLGSAISF